MPWAGGSFSRTDGTRTGTTVWAQAKAAAVKIIAAAHDTHDQDIATGVNQCVNKDGSNAFTGDADLGNNQLTNVGAGVAATDAATIGGTETLTGKTVTHIKLVKGADVASATALTLLTDGNYFDITGTTTVTSIATLGVGIVVKLHFDGALILTHHATDLILPGGANITTAAGDEAEFVEYAIGDWRCTNYQRAVGIGKVIQVAYVQDGAVATGTTIIPPDNTIPQIGEGNEFMTLAFTPKSASSKLYIESVCYFSNSSGNSFNNAALFQDAIAGALAAGAWSKATATHLGFSYIHHELASVGTSAITFRIRAGSGNAGTTTFNGQSGVGLSGGVITSFIKATEVLP